jgi:ribosomal protein L32
MLCSMCCFKARKSELWKCPKCGELSCRHIHVCNMCGTPRRTEITDGDGQVYYRSVPLGDE